MSTDHPRLRSLFEAACDLPKDERKRLLDAACGDDGDLRREVDRLLERDALRGDPLDDDALDRRDAVDRGDRDDDDGSLPRRIGRFTPHRRIGIGGMGVVYLATQENPAREVALKIIRRSRMGRLDLRRFELEADVLGRLQHPGIARIIEAGFFEEAGLRRPYFALEYIEGEALDRYAARQGLDVPARLALFLEICEAVAHAHQKGVVHRDLKPDNILVDRDGRARILDFGIARALSPTPEARATTDGQVLGTLPYMSPEQVLGDAYRIDLRTDVYALGVILHQLLSGRLPFDVADQGFVAASRVILDSEPESLGANDRSLRGDLETIVRTAIEKDPDRRYATVLELAGDVRRYLEHRPIQARPPTTIYQLRKFARRNRGLVAGAAIATVALVIGASVIGVQTRRLGRESETRAEVVSFLRAMLTSLDPAKTAGDPPTVRAMLDDASTRLERRFATSPAVLAELHDTVGTTYHQLGAYPDAERHLARAVALYGIGDAANRRSLEATAALGLTLRHLDRLEEARDLLHAALLRLRQPDAAGADRLRESMAIVLDELGRDEEAEALFRENYERAFARSGPDDADTLFAQNNLGKILMDAGHYEEAERHLDACLARRRARLGEDDPATLVTCANLGALYANTDRDELAAPLLREAAARSRRVLGPGHLSTLRREANLIRQELRLGRVEEGRRDAEALLGRCTALLAPSHAETLTALELAVVAMTMTGDRSDAERLATEWLVRVTEERGADHRSAARVGKLVAYVRDQSDAESDPQRER